MVMSSDFKTRLYTTRLTPNGDTHASDARILSGDVASIAFGGRTKALTETMTLESIQTNFGGGTQDGWFAVIRPEGMPAPSSTATPVPTAIAPSALSKRVYLPVIQR